MNNSHIDLESMLYFILVTQFKIAYKNRVLHICITFHKDVGLALKNHLKFFEFIMVSVISMLSILIHENAWSVMIELYI